MAPNVDLVIVFKATSISLSKQQVRDDALKAEQQYSKLLETLTKPGLRAVGRRGEKRGHLLILLSCPHKLLASLVYRERRSDFLFGLPMSELPCGPAELESEPLTPADRLRLVYSYVTSMHTDGGLGIIPGSKDWNLVDSVMALHDYEFNETWIRSWTTRQITSVKLESIRDQFGHSVALYFSFLSSYARALIFPSFLGIIFYLLKSPYSPIYSTLMLLWSIIFVEWWTIRERILSIRWGTQGSFKVEKRRADYIPGFPWWKKEMRMIASIPVIMLFAVVLAALLTAIFVFEAFVTQLYTGPGHKYISFSPTILFIALVPRVLAIYHAYALRFSEWENHAHQSTYEASLTIKTFSLSAIVAYLGLALSAFVYVPFGGDVMAWVHAVFIDGQVFGQFGGQSSEVVGDTKSTSARVWMTDVSVARRKLNPSRLQEQMFAYTVTNQVINTFLEIGLPYILRFVDSIRNGSNTKGHSRNASSSSGKKKRVGFEDQVAQQSPEKGGAESDKEGKEDREFLERVRSEAALPEYGLFGDYSEMVTQFGYVVLWSTIWPLAPVMALLNNFLELRSDAFKITHHYRRPIPIRTDTIGPWLSTLAFLTWLAALTNSALVYLFRNGTASNGNGSVLGTDHAIPDINAPSNSSKNELLFRAVLIALAASHGYIILRALVRHVLEKTAWAGSEEVAVAHKISREVKQQYLKNVGQTDEVEVDAEGETDAEEDGKVFWSYDEGLDEIRRAVKDA